MTDAGGKDEHIAGFQPRQATVFSSQPEGHVAFSYSKHFVRVGMEVCVIVNRIRPGADPSTLLECAAK
jgi:hypothetical protein